MPARGADTDSETWVVELDDVGSATLSQVGGKAVALGALQRHGLRIPPGLCVLTGAYDRFVDSAALRPAITLELGRKRFEDMRWEEVWDASLRIRSLFLRAGLEPALAQGLEDALRKRFGDGRPAVVRSSAPAEDSATTSFAGLHESYVNVRGIPALIEAIRQVWASLWTDRALLYRQELGLDVLASSMAVVVQELITGEVSGVAFSQSPLDDSQAVVEAVWGLNEALVDGTIEPDRWIVERSSGILVEHYGPVRNQKVVSRPSGASGSTGTHLVALNGDEQVSSPLTDAQLRVVVSTALGAERLFGLPQDVEWTVAGDDLWILQSRPISTVGATLQAEADTIARERAEAETEEVLGTSPQSGGAPLGRSGPSSPSAGPSAARAGTIARDERPWYLNLHKSFGKLRDLRHQVEEVDVPQMEAEAESMTAIALAALPDDELAAETARRQATLGHWEEVYYRDFIPLAHGVRLFGQVYNDKVRPADPYEFVDLLTGSGLLSVSRNAMLMELANSSKNDPSEPTAALDSYLDRFGSGPGTPEPVRAQERARLFRLVSEMARHAEGSGGRPPSGAAPGPVQALQTDRAEEYLGRFEGEERRFQEELLDLARASYRLRDDDNVHLGRIRKLTEAAVVETHARAAGHSPGRAPHRAPGRDDPPVAGQEEMPAPWAPRFKARQLVGQPAGPGIAVGTARVALDESDLYSFEAGEILVCDSLDPTMTFVAPLASAIVERRGGMLVHGAIIAREYGLPCVTGVPEATRDIHTGDLLTVDGFLGIVVVGGAPPGSVTPARPTPPPAVPVVRRRQGAAS